MVGYSILKGFIVKHLLLEHSPDLTAKADHVKCPWASLSDYYRQTRCSSFQKFATATAKFSARELIKTDVAVAISAQRKAPTMSRREALFRMKGGDSLRERYKRLGYGKAWAEKGKGIGR